MQAPCRAAVVGSSVLWFLGKWLGKAGDWLGRGARAIFRAGCSFDANTLVQTSEGPVPISMIEVGDLVLAKNEFTGVESYQEVVYKFSEWHDSALIVVAVGNEGGESITTTAEHPFYVIGKGFVPASALSAGERILLSGEKYANISEIREIQFYRNAFNITVNKDHTYFVGNNRILVHNSCRWLPLPSMKMSPFGAKIADDVPVGVPSNWSREQLQDAIFDYRTSIASRKAELPHSMRLVAVARYSVWRILEELPKKKIF